MANAQKRIEKIEAACQEKESDCIILMYKVGQDPRTYDDQHGHIYTEKDLPALREKYHVFFFLPDNGRSNIKKES